MRTDQALLHIIRHCQPRSILYCGKSAAEASEHWRKEMPEAQLSRLSMPPDNTLTSQSPVDLTLLSDCLETLSWSEGELLLGQLRNFVSGQIAVHMSGDAKLQFTDFLALGFKRWESDGLMLDHGCIYTYDIATYNHKRQWNSPENWANPENWDKYRW